MQLKQKIGFGTGLPNGGWQYTATQDPNPRVPFTHGLIGPGTEPVMQKWEKVAWSFGVGFWACFIAYHLLAR